MSGKKLVVGIDVGFGHTKAYTVIGGEGVYIKFPTWVAVANKGAYSEVRSYLYQGKELWVGDVCKHSQNRIEIATSEDIIQFYPVFKQAVLDEVKRVSLEKKVIVSNPVVITGLPPKYYFEVAKPHNKGVLMEDNAGEKRPRVIWQGLGVLLDVMMGEEMEFENGETVVVVDIGYNTVDYLIAMYTNQDWKKVSVDSIVDMGLMKAVDLFRQELPAELGVVKTWSKQRLIQAFEKGVVNIDGERIDLTAIKNKAIQTYSDILVNRLKGEIGEEMIVNDRLIVAGGGANIIANRLKEERRNIIIPKSPEFSNARGYWHYGVAIAQGE